MKGKPFLLFSWQRPFLEELKAWLGPKAGNAVIIIPNRRPARYLRSLFARDGKNAVLPNIHTFGDIINLWSASLPVKPLYMAGLLDQVALLEECVARVANEDKKLSERFASMETRRFLPWGARLANIYEELFIQGRDAGDFANLEYEVESSAAALLGALGRIGSAYRAALVERKWATPGFCQYLAANNASNIPARLLPSEERPVLIAGFAIPNGTEEKLFRALWEKGAQICLHTDTRIGEKGDFNRAAQDHADWIRRWRAETTIMAPTCGEKSPQMRFFSGYDLHSQLLPLAEELEKNPAPSTAIVLADEKLLLPVLHQLRGKDVNISMGYPVGRAPVAVLLEAIFRLHENRIGHPYWLDARNVISHPYLKFMGTIDAERQSLRHGLAMMENMLRNGPARVNLEELEEACLERLEGPVAQLFHEFSNLVLHRAGDLKTFRDAGNFLEDLCNFFLKYGENIWKRFPLDAEIIHRLVLNVAPALKNNALADRELPLQSIVEMLRRLIADEKIPFTSENLEGIQILGLLETRLLNFERVFFLDASDDALPGSTPRDPLLPNSLRSALGLGDNRRRESAVAHTLARLCAGANEAHFYWQQGVTRSQVADGKKYRSRFVEQLIWLEEQKQAQEGNTDANIIQVANAPVALGSERPKSIRATGAITARLLEILSGPISASMLNNYLSCPLKFAYGQILGLFPPAVACEGDNPALAGTFVHLGLKLLLEPYIGKSIKPQDLDIPKMVEKSFDLARNEMRKKGPDPATYLPPQSWLKLRAAYTINISSLLENFPENSKIVALEKNIPIAVRLSGTTYTFKGQLDRIDERDGLLRILDYKTGNIPKMDQEFWRDDSFFDLAAQSLRNKDCDFEELDQRLTEMSEGLSSIQLPFYITMLAADTGAEKIANAAFVELRKDGKETALFDNPRPDELENLIGHCATCVDLVLGHMRANPVFTGKRSQDCEYCPYAGICLS